VQLTVTAVGQNPLIASALSRKTHTGSTPLGPVDITVFNGTTYKSECRSTELGTATGNLLVLVNFDIPVQLVTGMPADVGTNAGSVASVTLSGASQVTVALTGMPHHQKLVLTFGGVADFNDVSKTCAQSLCVPVVVGDYDAGGRTVFLDFFMIKSAGYIDTKATATSFRADFDTNGTIQFLDFFQVKSRGLIDQPAITCP
jgi:hypothetical protein